MPKQSVHLVPQPQRLLTQQRPDGTSFEESLGTVAAKALQSSFCLTQDAGKTRHLGLVSGEIALIICIHLNR